MTVEHENIKFNFFVFIVLSLNSTLSHLPANRNKSLRILKIAMSIPITTYTHIRRWTNRLTLSSKWMMESNPQEQQCLPLPSSFPLPVTWSLWKQVQEYSNSNPEVYMSIHIRIYCFRFSCKSIVLLILFRSWEGPLISLHLYEQL